MEGDLKSILEGTDTETETVEDVVETPQVESAAEAVQEPEKGEAVQQETPAPTATPAVESDEIRGLKAALSAERRKRQEAERERMKQPQFDPQVLHQDPSEIVRYVDQRQFDAVVAMSRAMLMDQHADYEEMEEVFVEAAEANPALIAEMRQHPAPALFAYKTAKQLKAIKEAQDGSLEARLRAQIQAELEAKYKPAEKPPVTIPTDLSGARSATSTEDYAPESLESILKR